MKQHPILFSTDMVQAILNGSKTMTRRIVKMDDLIAQPDAFKLVGDSRIHDVPRPAIKYDDRIWFEWELKYNNHPSWITPFPYGKVGDVLWVREKWTPLDVMEGESDEDDNGETSPVYSVEFGFTDRYSKWGAVNEQYYNRIYDLIDEMEQEGTKWKPSIHMPKEACRIWLEITSIRVERLQDINDADSKSEGIRQFTKDGILKKYGTEGINWQDMPQTATDAFKILWKKIHGPESWESNPWVWVISFKKISKP